MMRSRLFHAATLAILSAVCVPSLAWAGGSQVPLQFDTGSSQLRNVTIRPLGTDITVGVIDTVNNLFTTSLPPDLNAWRRLDLVYDYHADPTGTTPVDFLWANMLNAAKTKGRKVSIPAGRFKFANQPTIDLNGWTTSFDLDCEGFDATTLDVTAVTKSPQMLITKSGGTPTALKDQFYGFLTRCAIQGDTTNVTTGTGHTVLAIGTPYPISDALNSNEFYLKVANSDQTHSDAVGTQINGNFASRFYLVSNGGGYSGRTSAGTVSVTNGSTAVTGSGTNFATAGVQPNAFIEIGSAWYRVASVGSNTSLTLTTPYSGSTASGLSVFTRNLPVGCAVQITALFSSTVQGSFGNADRALCFTGGYTFGNTFISLDLEESTRSIYVDPGIGAFTGNTFLDGQYSYTLGALDIQAGHNNLFIGPNDGPGYGQPSNFILNGVGVTVQSGSTVIPEGGTFTVQSASPSAGVNFNLSSNGHVVQRAIDPTGTGYETNYTAGAHLSRSVTATGAHDAWVGSTLAQQITATAINVGVNHQYTGNLVASVAAGSGGACTVASTCHNNAGRITVGSGSPSSVAITFNSATPFANPPFCMAVDETNANALRPTAISTTSVTFTAASGLAASDRIAYVCLGL